MSDWTKKDTAKETSSSVRETSRAWHTARDDAAGSGFLNERNDNKTSDSEEGSILNGIFNLFRSSKGPHDW